MGQRAAGRGGAVRGGCLGAENGGLGLGALGVAVVEDHAAVAPPLVRALPHARPRARAAPPACSRRVMSVAPWGMSPIRLKGQGTCPLQGYKPSIRAGGILAGGGAGAGRGQRVGQGHGRAWAKVPARGRLGMSGWVCLRAGACLRAWVWV